jgi:hypothetical protein
MIIDIIACIPFSLIENALSEDANDENRYNTAIRLARLPRLYKLLRLSRVVKMFKTYGNSDLMEKIRDFF